MMSLLSFKVLPPLFFWWRLRQRVWTNCVRLMSQYVNSRTPKNRWNNTKNSQTPCAKQRHSHDTPHAPPARLIPGRLRPALAQHAENIKKQIFFHARGANVRNHVCWRAVSFSIWILRSDFSLAESIRGVLGTKRSDCLLVIWHF
jgi:hypothetical protein